MNSISTLRGNKWLVGFWIVTLLVGLVESAARAQYAGSQACQECHSGIYGTWRATPHFGASVGCENCHGPSAAHAADYSDPTVLPTVDTLGTVCGNCHTGAQHPYYTEWSSSAHKTVSVGCPTCHDPHATHTWTNVLTARRYTDQLRSVMVSTNNYVNATPGITSPNVNLCAQCHNHHGASWTNTASAPVTPQFNMLLGAVGEFTNGSARYAPAMHAWLTNQCVYCHMATAPYQSPTKPAITGHKFTVQLFGECLACHPQPQPLLQFVMGAVTNRVLAVKYELDQWALTKAPAALRTKYGRRAWEYSTPGELSSGGAGPTAAEQAQIPVTIRKARFNLYLVQRDGSGGAHNGPHFIDLLDAAQTWVETELRR
jgi:formate-dependent nitrite reductase cytochrome c552 subunit